MLRLLISSTTGKKSLVVKSALILFALLAPFSSLQAAIPDKHKILQFTAADHVLGFQSNGFYVASGDHMLHVDFIGTFGVLPRAADTGKGDNKTPVPLTQVTYPDLWPGVSLRYETTAGGIAQSTWEVAAGTDVKQIRLGYNGPLEIKADGSLQINYETGRMHESAPIAWQEIGGCRRPVEVAFHLVETSRMGPVIGFKIGYYNPAHPLLIDPTLAWNTFMGSDTDSATAITVDGSGNIYVAGYSNAAWGTPSNPYSGGYDAFVAKLDTNGVLQWNTFLGSTGNDYGSAIGLDGSDIYVAGDSDTTWGTPLASHAGDTDVFIAKLNYNGIRTWHTFLGSANTENSTAIDVDGNNNVYVAGYGNATWGTPLSSYADGYDAFIAKINASGNLTWNTFMGSSGEDVSMDITVDSNDNVYVIGYSDATWGTPVNSYADGYDAFVAKLDASGNLTWNTFMGSSSNDMGNAIVLDGSSYIYIAGSSDATWESPLTPHAGNFEIFTSKLKTIDGGLEWNTFMGSSGGDAGEAITVDNSGNVYVTGYSDSTWGTPLNFYTSGHDTFVARLSASGDLVWNTFMGSPGYDIGMDITMDDNDNVYVAGYGNTTWGSPVNAFTGENAAFVTKITPLSNELGDLNADDIIDLKDAILALMVIAGQTPTSLRPDYPNAWVDVNDGRVGMAEAIYTLRKMAETTE